jgi:hypothetical protein
LAGLGVGLLYGVFGIGSAFATPVLALLGVPGLAAVVAPLPALLPGSAVGAWSYLRNDCIDRPLAKRTITFALPAAVAGAVASHHVDADALLVLSGVVLLLAGLRVLLPARPGDDERAEARRTNAAFVALAAVLVGFAAGLLANGGGFLLVPLFIVLLGVDVSKAIGTSLLAATVLTVPTLVTHIVLGGIDWSVAGLFAVGLAPGTFVGGYLAQRVSSGNLRKVFGVFLVVFAGWYLTGQLA